MAGSRGKTMAMWPELRVQVPGVLKVGNPGSTPGLITQSGADSIMAVR